MSATNRGAVRVQRDFYPTPADCIKLIMDRVDWDKVVHVMEPCRGSGAIQKMLPFHTPYQYDWCEIVEGKDYLKEDLPRVSLTITNPPYNFAQQFLERSLPNSICTVYLLRTNFLESETRRAFLSANRPTHLYNLCKRPSFVDVCDGFPKTKSVKKIKGCGWAFQKIDAVKICPNCGGRVKAGTDATAYAWFCWDYGEIMRDVPGIHFL